MSFLQLGYSALAAAGLMGVAVVLVIGGVFELFSNGLDSPQAASSFLMAYSLGLIGLLCLPSAWTSLRQLMNKNEPVPNSPTGFWGRLLPGMQRLDAFGAVTLLSILVLPITLALGHLAAQNENLAWLVLPPLNLVATGLPVLWLALLGMRKLQGGSAQQRWGVLAVGLVLAPLLILLVELVLLAAAGVVALAYLTTQPEQLDELLNLLQQMRSLPSPDQEALLRMLEPYLAQRWVMVGLVLLAAFFVPLIEELLKPLGVWLLAWKKLTPAQGLVGGILSGAGFALFENLGNTSGAGEMWALVIASRIPAALLHMLTSGLLGWAIASAWTNRRYLRLVATFAVSVTIHGLWNGLAVLGAATLPVDQTTLLTPELPTNGIAAVAGLVILFTLNVFLYLLINRSLRPKPERVEILTT